MRLTRRASTALGLVASLCLASAGAQAQPTPRPQAVHEARALFQQGLALVREERWGEALEYFRRSRALAERPSTIFNIGSVLVRTGRMAEAVSVLEEFLRVSDPRANEAERREAERLLTDARNARARLTLTLTAAATVWLDGAQLEGDGVERVIALDPGEHQLRVQAAGYEEEAFTVSALPGQTLGRSVELRPQPTRILLAVTPADARVTLDGRERGLEREFSISPGAHRVSLRAPQHLPLERQVSLALGETARLDLSLARQPRVAITSSPWFWTAIGAVVVGAAATAIALTYETRLDPYGGTTDSLLSGVRSVP